MDKEEAKQAILFFVLESKLKNDAYLLGEKIKDLLDQLDTPQWVNGVEPIVVGDGSIFFCCGGEVEGKPDQFILVRGEPGEIGRSGPELLGKTIDSIPTMLRLKFSNAKSLRVCWEEMGKLLALMDPAAPKVEEGGAMEPSDNTSSKHKRVFNEYIVTITESDGTPVDSKAKYFVLRYDCRSKDLKARLALMEYAQLTENKELAAEIIAQEISAGIIEGLTGISMIEKIKKEGL